MTTSCCATLPTDRYALGAKEESTFVTGNGYNVNGEERRSNHLRCSSALATHDPVKSQD